MARPTPIATRKAAVRDYVAGESSNVVGDRYGVSATSVTDWVRAAGENVRTKAGGPAPKSIAYHGGWTTRGGIRVPLLPESRSA